jgi:hypothetical protein
MNEQQQAMYCAGALLTHDWGVEHHSSVWCVEGEYWFTDAELITFAKEQGMELPTPR